MKNLTKVIIAIALTAGIVAVPSISFALPAFPGAEGYGTETQGGRYDDAGNPGRVLIVNTLEDYLPGKEPVIVGSLRWALEDQSGPRIVVFRVSGTIELKTDLKIVYPYITVAGQTAPGDGITLKGASLGIGQKWNSKAHDVVIRYIRVRPGNDNHIYKSDLRAITIVGTDIYNIVIDHCSFSWSTDSLSEHYGHNNDVTYSWNIFSEGLMFGGHGDGLHSMGYAGSYGSDRFSIHHNLFVHNSGRNPHIIGQNVEAQIPEDFTAREFDICNNIVYNFGYEASGIKGKANANYIGNFVITGNDTPAWNTPGLSIGDRLGYYPSVYVQGNIGPSRESDTQDEWDICGSADAAISRAYAPFSAPVVTTHNYLEAYHLVLEKAGAIFPARDSVDVRVLNDVKERKGNYIDNQYDVGGWPELDIGIAPSDRDNDGMPDDWEISRGLNPDYASDATIDSGDGYLNIEKYINSLVESNIPTAPNYPPFFRKIKDLQRPKRIAKEHILEFPVEAQDPEGLPATITAQNLPSGALFDGATFKWVPAVSDIGSYQVVFIASDGVKSTSQTVAITVTTEPDNYFTDWDPRTITRTGSTYYVATTGDDTAGDGSELAPFASISRAARFAKPGDTVIVKGGVYYTTTTYDKIHTWFGNRGRADAPILFTAADGEEVIIHADYSIGETHGFIFETGGTSYLWFNGFTFRGFTQTAIFIPPYSHHIWFTNCKIYECAQENNNRAAIFVKGSKDIVFENCLIDGGDNGIATVHPWGAAEGFDSYINVKDCEIRNVGNGIKYIGWYLNNYQRFYPSDWLLVNNCYIHDNTGYAITSDAENVYVLNTTLENNLLGLNLTGKNVYIENDSRLPTLPGDFDGDGDVDLQDLLIVAKGYGLTYDLQDLLLVAMHYGEKI